MSGPAAVPPACSPERVVLKCRLDGTDDIMRLSLERPASLRDILGKICAAFGHAVTKVKYVDGDGDRCLLNSHTFDDFDEMLLRSNPVVELHVYAAPAFAGDKEIGDAAITASSLSSEVWQRLDSTGTCGRAGDPPGSTDVGSEDELGEDAEELVVRAKSDLQSRSQWAPLGALPCRGRGRGIEVKCSWRDQGWGNQKGRVRVRLLRCGCEGQVVHEEDLFGLCGRHPKKGEYVHVQRKFRQDEPLASLAEGGDTYAFEYWVGGGGGHQLHIKDFVVGFSGCCAPLE